MNEVDKQLYTAFQQLQPAAVFGSMKNCDQYIFSLSVGSSTIKLQFAYHWLPDPHVLSLESLSFISSQQNVNDFIMQ